MKKIKLIKIVSVILAVLVVLAMLGMYAFLLFGSVNTVDNSDGSSFRKQADISMEHAQNPKLLATVNDIEITQIDYDCFRVGGEEKKLNELIEYFVKTDYAERNGIEMEDLFRTDEIMQSIKEDEELSEEYCQQNYGVSKTFVMDYMYKRSYLINRKYSFDSYILDKITDGSVVEMFPAVKNEYKSYVKARDNGNSIFDLGRIYRKEQRLEKAIYREIKKEYDIKITFAGLAYQLKH